MKHRATPRFWACYHSLPNEVQHLADNCYARLKQNPNHPSLHLKKIQSYWSVRVGLHYRALAIESGNDLVWFWIGTHAEYDRLIAAQ
jgi:hypothetical protein